MYVCLYTHLCFAYKLALTSLTGSGRSVGIVRSRTKAVEFLNGTFVLLSLIICNLFIYLFINSDDNIVSLIIAYSLLHLVSRLSAYISVQADL
jgi:hypothetical protein